MKKDNELFNDFEWFDCWGEDYEMLMEAGDYHGLVKCCLERYQRDPGDPHAIEVLADAYVLNAEYQKALDLVSPFYFAEPDHPCYPPLILDALLNSGRSIDDFPWKSPPDVLYLTEDTLDECYKYLKPKRLPRTLDELYMKFMIKSYLLFSEDELLNALQKDNRFSITNPENGSLAKVSVRRKRRYIKT